MKSNCIYNFNYESNKLDNNITKCESCIHNKIMTVEELNKKMNGIKINGNCGTVNSCQLKSHTTVNGVCQNYEEIEVEYNDATEGS